MVQTRGMRVRKSLGRLSDSGTSLELPAEPEPLPPHKAHLERTPSPSAEDLTDVQQANTTYGWHATVRSSGSSPPTSGRARAAAGWAGRRLRWRGLGSWV